MPAQTSSVETRLGKLHSLIRPVRLQRNADRHMCWLEWSFHRAPVLRTQRTLQMPMGHRLTCDPSQEPPSKIGLSAQITYCPPKGIHLKKRSARLMFENRGGKNINHRVRTLSAPEGNHHGRNSGICSLPNPQSGPLMAGPNSPYLILSRSLRHFVSSTRVLVCCSFLG
jgi:hypothetical protein